MTRQKRSKIEFIASVLLALLTGLVWREHHRAASLLLIVVAVLANLDGRRRCEFWFASQAQLYKSPDDSLRRTFWSWVARLLGNRPFKTKTKPAAGRRRRASPEEIARRLKHPEPVMRPEPAFALLPLDEICPRCDRVFWDCDCADRFEDSASGDSD